MRLLGLPQLPSPANQNDQNSDPGWSELNWRLQAAVVQLQEESERVHANMERALFRLMTQGTGVCLEGLTTGRWQALAAEVSAIQEALQALEDLG